MTMEHLRCSPAAASSAAGLLTVGPPAVPLDAAGPSPGRAAALPRQCLLPQCRCRRACGWLGPLYQRRHCLLPGCWPPCRWQPCRRPPSAWQRSRLQLACKCRSQCNPRTHAACLRYKIVAVGYNCCDFAEPIRVPSFESSCC